MTDADHPTEPAPRIALVTYAEEPILQPDDEPLAASLRCAGVRVDAAAWNDPACDWEAFDALVLRSTWDYFRVPHEFRAWLAAREAARTRVLNPPSAVRWNLDKRYLRALEARGVPVVSTRWVEPGDAATLAATLDAAGWDAAVVKPAVSASAWNTWRTRRATAPDDEARFAALVARGPVMVQPYLADIERDGEWSLLFFGGEYSHAVRKRPRAGDFRVQKEFGGTATAGAPPEAARAAAARALAESAALAGMTVRDLAYARVDGCMVDGRWMLMELELVEPTLFLTHDARAADRCAAAIVEALRVQPA